MKVRMYTCGPSTYQQAHIGNYRTFLFEDIIQRYLEYQGYTVKRLMTLTNVEDKAIVQAEKEKISIEELTSKNERVFFKDFKLLRIKVPDYTVRASDAVDQASKLTDMLVEKGYAYWYSYLGAKNAYFDALKFKDFGKLVHLDLSKWPKKKRRFHKDTYPGTPWNLGDFVLWHGCKKGDTCFDSKVGRGRPSWNLQDAAIVTKHLGFAVDIACGGVDNLIRHHDYTLAIVEAVSGRDFSRFWLHGEHLLVENKKMSKSIGNVYYLNDLIEKGFNAGHVRFFLVYGHYRRKLNFTFGRLEETSHKLDALKDMINDLQKKKSAKDYDVGQLSNRLINDFENHMNNDLDVKSAFDSVFKTIQKIHEIRETLSAEQISGVMRELRRIDTVLQCVF
jgi:cysteinyl-tRNA synthetase